ncbi:amidohydrolase family protein [Pseudarthrobacter raffinosi]|uniref:amidohydrolase family protein n=1 Tax=Pseudarthrobacter raffinosi TaxID=2953651 RepID=UPI00208EBF2D|nr:amidohydrolase family protein [Pseudarthrobacter sp. MDT3-9]MCO4251238.1 amidohydrolase family protein [Pseudarthrobacter sp. MDT3-9]
MKLITLEEHYLDLAVVRASAAASAQLSPHFSATYDPKRGAPYSPAADVLIDLDEGRLADMDRNGIDMQVLSCLTTQQLPSDVAAELVANTNDTLAAAVARHPDRFAAFASLPTSDPAAAATELKRAVQELGMVGTLIHGRTEGEFLSSPQFEPILQTAAELEVPLYLHPGIPPRATTASNYDGFDPFVSTRLQTTAWGWHQETAVHFLHLVLSGVFDRFPKFQVILGHWGEMVPFFLERLDESLPQSVTGLERTFEEYMKQNVYITPSGMFNQAQLQFCVETVGVDRIMYAVDYPFIGNGGAAAFLEAAKLSGAAREAIGHGNAERLFGL